MSSNRGFENNNGIASNNCRLGIVSIESFTRGLIEYFRNGLSHRNLNETVIVRRSREYFRLYLEREEFFSVYLEVLFSFFEIRPRTSNAWIRRALFDFMVQKVKARRLLILGPQRAQRYRLTPLNTIPFFFDDVSGRVNSVDTFYSPSFILDFGTAGRLFRYGGRFELCPLQLEKCLTSMFHFLSETLLPSNFENVSLTCDKIPEYYTTYWMKKRLYFVLLVIGVLQRRQQLEMFPGCRRSRESVKLFFKTIKDPLVAFYEVHRFLNMGLAGENKIIAMQDFLDDTIKEFPKSVGSMSPRSLKHLSRCQVRECMANVGNLPHGVSSLSIPHTLKNYVLLQRWEEEFYPQYVAELSAGNPTVPDYTTS